MSISFYYVVTFNVQHPTVKKMLDKLQFTAISDSLIELKTRSKLYLDYDQVSAAAHDDFDLKLTLLYNNDQKDQIIRCISATNPMFDPDAEDMEYEMGEWDEYCAGSIFSEYDRMGVRQCGAGRSRSTCAERLTSRS